MADRSLEGMALPLEVRARLAELELELSEGNRPGRAAPRCRREAAAGRAGGRVVPGALGLCGARRGPRLGHCVSPPGCAAAGPGARDGGAGLAGPCPCARPRAAPAAQAGDGSRRSACGARPCSNEKLVVGLEHLTPDVPDILVFQRPVQLGDGCATIVRRCCDAQGGRLADLLPQARFPASRPSLGSGIGDRFAAVISWSVMYGFLFALKGGIMCSTVISLDQVWLCLKKKSH